MRLVVRVMLIGALVLGFGSLVGLSTPPAQDQALDRTDSRPTDKGDNAKPFVPPAASKSVEIANYYFRKKMYNAALSRYQEATKTDSYYAPGYLGLGRTYERIGLKQKALDAYQKYLDLLPSAKQADEAKHVHEAMARLEHALQRSGSNTSASRR